MGRIFMRATPDTDTVTNNTVAGGIDAAKVGAGTVNNTEFGYLDGVSSPIQTQLDVKFTLPALTNSSVLFSNGTTIAQNNTAFNWDNTNTKLTIRSLDATLSGAAYPLTIGHNVTGTPAGGLATAIKFQGQTSTTANTDMAEIQAYYNSATHASRAVLLRFFVNDSAGNIELMRLTSSNVNFFRAPSTNGFGYVANSFANTGFDVASTTGKFINGTMTAGTNGTANVVSAFDVRCASTTTNGFGARRLTTLYTTSALNNACYEDIIWQDATHASRTSAWVLSLSVNGTMGECLRAYNGGLIVGGATLNSSAKLQIDSTTQGFLKPRMTTAQINAIVSPAEGLEVYNTSLHCPCFYDGTAWQRVSYTAM